VAFREIKAESRGWLSYPLPAALEFFLYVEAYTSAFMKPVTVYAIREDFMDYVAK